MIEGEQDEIFDPFDVDPIERMIYDDTRPSGFGDPTEQGREDRRNFVRDMLSLIKQKHELDLTHREGEPRMPVREFLERMKHYPALYAIALENLTDEDIGELLDDTSLDKPHNP